MTPTDLDRKARELAVLFHDTYERLAPSFGYETRTETRAFDPASPNGQLMIAVCRIIISKADLRLAAPASVLRDTDRLNWLATNPRGAEIMVDGERKPCIFWGVSSAPENTLREAIDAAMIAAAPTLADEGDSRG